MQAGDAEGTGICSKQHLLQMCLLHFNVLLTPGELDCLKAEWQVMDHITGEVGVVSDKLTNICGGSDLLEILSFRSAVFKNRDANQANGIPVCSRGRWAASFSSPSKKLTHKPQP